MDGRRLTWSDWPLALVVLAPWIAGIVWFWRRRPRDGAIPLSMAEHARRRLWPD
jgi:hypothetical protein